MSTARAYSPPLMTAQRGDLAPIDLPTRRMTPAEISLTLSANVLRLPYPPATRLVLAEIVSLCAANGGCCDASDPHFAARLTINKDTVSVAVAKLEADGLVTKVVTRVQGGKYRTLTPVLPAIAAKAATNPYPEVEPPTRRNFRRVEDSQTGNSGLHTPEFPDSHAGNSGFHTPEFPDSHAGNSGGNTTVNTTGSFQLNNHSQSAADAARAGAEKKIVGAELSDAGADSPDASASHTGPANRVPTRKAATKPAGPLLLRDSPLAEFTDFAEAWQAAADAHPETYADYSDANLRHYHTALLDWSNANGKKKLDWLATIRSSIRNDHANGKLRTYSTPSASHSTTHANGSSNTFNRQHSSEKPSSEGTLLAGALASRRWQQRNGGPSNP